MTPSSGGCDFSHNKIWLFHEFSGSQVSNLDFLSKFTTWNNSNIVEPYLNWFGKEDFTRKNIGSENFQPVLYLLLMQSFGYSDVPANLI